MDITDLLAFSVQQGASDLHLSVGLPPMIRVDGDVRRVNVPAQDHAEVQALVYDIMNDRQRKDYEEFLETDFSFEVPGVARFRVNAFNQNRGAGAVFRTIPSEVLSMETLSMGQVFRDISMIPRGLVLVTGPTGSGKSTTLAAMIDFINDNRYDHILTIEDPIEFVHESKRCLVNQREVHRDTLGFSEALRSALREDPDITLVGEMRDLETIRLALTAAETGHLVFGTLHTTSAAKTIDRRFSSGRESYGALDAVRVSAGCHFTNPAEEKKWRSGCGARNHAWHVGDPKSDSRGQSRADVFSYSDGPSHRHANHGSVPARAGREAHHYRGSGPRKSAATRRYYVLTPTAR
jgi:pilus retraction protein PilT